MISGNYRLEVFCEHRDNRRLHPVTTNDQAAVFEDDKKAACIRRARRLGWRLNLQTGTALCPRCVKHRQPLAVRPAQRDA